ncbi:MAG: MFS transporter [Eubacteriales bacterium]|nr:MFS transporter [Eubacteriales bacterium]
MKQQNNPPFAGLKAFLLLWSTQALSALGSAMTSFALVVWSYEQQGSALTTALLSVCSYAPYVLLSIFAGALSDRWDKKRTMLVCDSLAALSTLGVLALLRAGCLQIWHLYALNALNGLMNTLQQPASDVAASLLAPREQYQRVGGLRALSCSLTTVLSPVLATAAYALAGMDAVILIDLATFAVAFAALAFFIRVPKPEAGAETPEPVLQAVKSGLRFLRRNRGILDLILFLAAINLTASMYNAALPAMLLPRPDGGRAALGLVEMCAGLANVAGSLIVSLAPAPKSRVRAIVGSLLFAMSTENLILALGKSLPVWCVGAVLGWLFIPVMNANLDVLFRSHIPIRMQGRVYAARNSLQFFTIPVGYLLGGALVDHVCEPFMAAQTADSPFRALFGAGKGAGAALLFAGLAVLGVATCLYFRRSPHIRRLEQAEHMHK